MLYTVDDTVIAEFAKKSLTISGIREPAETAEEKKACKKAGNAVDYLEPTSFFKLLKRYKEICKYQLVSEHLCCPQILNHGLLNGLSENAGRWRTGVSAHVYGSVPKAESLKQLTDEWYADALTLIADDHTYEENISDAQHLYFRFLCIEPFSAANGRTARLLHNSIRIRIELPWLVSTYEEITDELKAFREYREEHFIPKYKAYL